MLRYLWFAAVFGLSLMASQPASAKETSATLPKPTPAKALQCTGFSPYVGKLTPDYGVAPSKELIDTLLEKLIAETPFRCIMTYGVTNGLDYIFAAAQARNIKVIAILWLDKDITVNSQSISSGIAVAKAFPDTIIKLSCGSEVRTRHDYRLDGEITRCIQALREAGIKQPVTTIDTWWEWCNRKSPCETTNFGAQVDWIGTNIFPWWENKFSGAYPCIPAQKAADFHIDRMAQLQKTYPGKPVVVTEFGWPSGPKGSTEINNHTQQHCGIASKQNQLMVIKQTFKKLAQKHWSGVVFEAFEETWKPSNERQCRTFLGDLRGGAAV